ncbi:WAP-type 'four-disulfide core [Trichuris suis]|nr:WAP-type 'four-disulfide core [Trichuris suis]
MYTAENVHTITTAKVMKSAVKKEMKLFVKHQCLQEFILKSDYFTSAYSKLVEVPEKKLVHPLMVEFAAKHDRYCPDVADDKEMRNAKLCNADSDCFDIQKCCPTSLTLRCQRPSQYAPLPKEGRCKEEQGHIPVGYLPSCTDDYDCMGMKKCCFQNGTIDCIDV